MDSAARPPSARDTDRADDTARLVVNPSGGGGGGSLPITGPSTAGLVLAGLLLLLGGQALMLSHARSARPGR